MRRREEGNVETLIFDSMNDVTSWIERTPATWSHSGSTREGRSHAWDLGAGYAGALHMARYGWEEGWKKIAALLGHISTDVITVREVSVAGDYPDVARAVAGDPFNMVKRGKVRAPKPSITLGINIGASAAVTAQAFANYGAAMAALVDRLEARGVRVELWALWGNGHMSDGGKVNIAVKLKDMAAALDLSAVAFAVGHPAFMRRVGLALLERSGRRKQIDHYGVPYNIERGDSVDLQGALCVAGIATSSDRCKTLTDAMALAEQQINAAAGRLGLEPFAELREEM